MTLLLGIISRHVIGGGGVFFSQYIFIVSRQSMVNRSTFISERQRTDESTMKHMKDSTARNSYMYIVVFRAITATIPSVKIGVHLHYLLFDVSHHRPAHLQSL